MLVLPWEQTQPLGTTYDQAGYLHVLGRWFVRGKSFPLTQAAAAKKECQKILDAPQAQPFCILVKSLTELTLWHETPEVPEIPSSPVTEAAAEVPQVKMFRGQAVHAAATAAPAQNQAVVKTYRGQVVQSQSTTATPAATVKPPKIYRGKTY